MGCFHSDFESSEKKEGAKVMYADMCIYVSKKVYACRLQSKRTNGELFTEYHLRFKGINGECLILKAEIAYESDPMKLYESLYNGEKIAFDLADVKVIMK